ncbi:ROK family transcriptional regulator [Paenibacillus andongensis]|uniref:ROK family transcriptional regulator n=1 Tax=Paenibacillus andongensis TaxID=2975482 RepID=UPI0021BB9ACF|nr:ROK family transcriptional regulator [Paenibacillus andongensis]
MTAKVLQIIRRAKLPLSKAELAEETGVSLSAISVHVERLLEEKLIEVSKIGVSSGGRKPRQYALNKNIGLILSIELGTSFVHIALTNFNCEILYLTTSDIDITDGPDRVLTRIHELVDQMLLENKVDKVSIKGIGIGIPGPVDFSMGIPISPTIMPGWDKYPIREFWSKYFDCPCYVDNDVNTMALGEHAKGLQFEVSNLIYVKVGSGIGSGIIYDGVLYRGSTGSAGDIGHFDIGSDVVCWCGNKGCLEASAGGKAIVSKGKERALSHRSEYLLQILNSRGKLTIDDIGTGVLQLDSTSVALVRESGTSIGRVIASIVNFANPDLVVIGGRVAEFGDIFLAAIRQSVYQRSLPLATRNLIINKSVLGNMAGLIGGAFMTIDQIIIQSTDNEADIILK